MSLPKNPSLSEQLEQHDINRQIAKEMRESEKALREEIVSLKKVNAGLLEALIKIRKVIARLEYFNGEYELDDIAKDAIAAAEGGQ